MGTSVWELFCLEHGIQPDGKVLSESAYTQSNTVFNETSTGTYVPRAVFIDLEPAVIGLYRSIIMDFMCSTSGCRSFVFSSGEQLE